MRRYLFLSFISFLLIVFSTTVVNFVAIGNAIPDLLLMWIVYIAITQGQLTGTLFGFSIGLFVDVISGNDGMLGLSALCKSLAGFVAGYFYHENKIEINLSTSKFLFAVGTSALLHNALYFVIFLRGSDVGWWSAIVAYGIPSMLYTTALAVVPMSLFRRKFQ